MSVNNFIEISDKIGQLTALRLIDLGHNQIKEIPITIGNLQNLDSFICLHNNQIETLPDEIAV